MSLLAFDTFTALYRVKMSSENNYELNKTLAKQLRSLVEIARKKEIPVLCTAQMYQDFDDPEQYNVVGGQIVQNMSKCLLEMRKEDDDLRRLIIKKHRSQPSGKEVAFRIVEDGLEEASYEPRDV
jgi:RecA/RadA recombinase